MSNGGTKDDSAGKRKGGARKPAMGLERPLEALISEIDLAAKMKRSGSSHGKRALCAVTGWGAVSPAGWTAGALREALLTLRELPIKTERRCEGAPERRVRPVPPHASPPDWMKQPR